jgi:hypothetical protein
MQRKPQQQTLSLRISAELRNYLERAREVFTSHHQESGVAGCVALRQGQLDGDVVPQIVAALVRQLRQSAVPLKLVFAGRTLHVALCEERVDGIASLNQSLCPICRCSIAWPRAVIGCGSGARRAPPGGGKHLVSRVFPSLVGGDYRICMRMAREGEAEMLIEMDRKGISYPLGSYPRVREFGTSLARLEATGRWERGREERRLSRRTVCDPPTVGITTSVGLLPTGCLGEPPTPSVGPTSRPAVGDTSTLFRQDSF